MPKLVQSLVAAQLLCASAAFAEGAPKPAAPAANAAAAPKKLGYDDTPMQPNGKWHVHDGNRPQPPVVTPGTFPANGKPGTPPSDAVVLVGAKGDLSMWQHPDGRPAEWKFKGGVLEAGKDRIRTKQKFKDFQLHVEWASPEKVVAEGQGRGNSGVFLLGTFEVQVLDSWQNPTYPDGQAGAVYAEYPPLVNATTKTGTWQAYDIAFRAPRFKQDGKLEAPAQVTVFHNGVVLHHAVQPWGPTSHKKVTLYDATMGEGPIELQDHGNPVRYRNIWIRPLKDYDQP